MMLDLATTFNLRALIPSQDKAHFNDSVKDSFPEDVGMYPCGMIMIDKHLMMVVFSKAFWVFTRILGVDHHVTSKKVKPIGQGCKDLVKAGKPGNVRTHLYSMELDVKSAKRT